LRLGLHVDKDFRYDFRMGHTRDYPEPLMTRFPEGTMALIERALPPGRNRQDFVREVVREALAAQLRLPGDGEAGG
jgi:hypothetical protein